MARRISRLSNGGEDELTMILVLTLTGSTTQMALGACVMTSTTSSYQDLRGFLRNFCWDFPISMSNVHLTSLDVNGLPSCHLTPCLSLKSSVLPSALQAQLSASSGTIDSRLFCATSCL